MLRWHSVVPAAGRQQADVPLPAALLGEQDPVDIRIAVDRPFVEATGFTEGASFAPSGRGASRWRGLTG